MALALDDGQGIVGGSGVDGKMLVGRGGGDEENGEE
jgi:hypothetical protein